MSMMTSTGVVYDDLIGSSKVPLITKNVEFAQVAKEKTLKRGTLLAINADGKYVELNSTSEKPEEKIAKAITKFNLTVSSSSTVLGTVYISGMFNANAITLAQESDKIENHEEELRTVGIYLTNIHGNNL